MKVGDLVRYTSDRYGSGIGFVVGEGHYWGQYIVFMMKHNKEITLHGGLVRRWRDYENR